MTEDNISSLTAAWETKFNIAPCLRNVSWSNHFVRSTFTGVHRNPLWVLDYSRSATLKIKVGFNKAPWIDRGVREGHLYPPRTAYWEDWGPDDGRIHKGCYIIFTGGTGAGLQRFVHPHWKYAKFMDPHGRIEDLIHSMALKGNGLDGKNFWDAQADFCRLMQVLESAVRGEKERWHIPPGA